MSERNKFMAILKNQRTIKIVFNYFLFIMKCSLTSLYRNHFYLDKKHFSGKISKQVFQKAGQVHGNKKREQKQKSKSFEAH